MAAQYVIGIWEFNVNNLNTQLIKNMEEYTPTLFDTAWKQPQLRTIPVGSSIHSELNIMPYEKAEALLETHEKFAVLPCICHRERKMVGEGCDKPEESCLAFGMAADYAIKNGYGRAVEKAEILVGLAVLLFKVALQDLLVPASILPSAEEQAKFLQKAEEYGARPKIIKNSHRE